jgi:hypothetical protein
MSCQVTFPQHHESLVAPVGALPQPSLASTRRPSIELASSRAFASNPNHHLWRNGRLWWIAFSLLHDGWRQERIRQSLGTDNLIEARRRRDAILSIFTPSTESCLDPEPDAVTN